MHVNSLAQCLLLVNGRVLAQSSDPPNPLHSLCSIIPESFNDSISTNNTMRENRGLVTSWKSSSKLITNVDLQLRFPESESNAFLKNKSGNFLWALYPCLRYQFIILLAYGAGTQLTRTRVIYISLQHNDDIKEFLCESILSGKVLKILTNFGCAHAENGGLRHK